VRSQENAIIIGMQTTRRFALVLSLVLSFAAGLWLTAPFRSAGAKDLWTSVRSKHFFLIGNASEREIRQIARQLEQFRAVFARLLLQAEVRSPVPTTVVVFKSDASYRPFKPLYRGKPAEIAGYFQSGHDVNYITLTLERHGADPYATLFHEYVHALTNDNLRDAPLWFREGLAEYYSTFNVTDGEKKIWLGRAHADHVRRLRTRQFLSLATLFAVDQTSPHYNEQDQRNIFYAQSWVLVHYLMLGNKGQRQPQFQRFIQALVQGAPLEESFRQIFQTDYAGLESELSAYVERHNYPTQIVTLDQRVEFDSTMRSAPISEAEAQAYLGDLLRHLQRLDEAETYFQAALTLAPDLSTAHASLGMLRAQEKRFAEARRHLRRALTADAQNYLAHYYYAFALTREDMDEHNRVTRFAAEKAQGLRAALKKAIALAPEFAESYRLLAFVNLVNSEQLDESVALLQRARALAPTREEYTYLLAQLHLARQDYETARQTVTPLARAGGNPQLRQDAQDLLATITLIIERLARFAAEQGPLPPEAQSTDRAPRSLVIAPPPDLRRSEGEQARGLLINVDCAGKGLLLIIRAGGHVLALRSTAPERVRFLPAAPEIRLECGPRQPPLPVRVTYRATVEAGPPFDGELLEVEFVKPE
jgi:tetratricopeptide (TPR) repeat protein